MTAPRPLVTVCMPTTGRMTYLDYAFRSLREQTYPNVEVIVLDNASPPDCQEALARFQAATPNVRILRVEPRVPMFANFNRGVRAARGEYVVYFHDDDVYEPTFIERYVDLLESHPTVGFAGGNFDIIDHAGAVVRRKRGIAQTETWDGRYFIDRVFRRGRSDLPTPALFFRRSALERFDFDEQISIYWGDYTVQMRMAERWGVAVMAEPLYSWRKHGRNDSNISLSEAMAIRTRVMQDFCDEYLSRHPEEGAFVSRMRALNHRAQLYALLWAWLGAEHLEEQRACRELLGRSHPGAAGILRGLERLGFSRTPRRLVWPAVRRLVGWLNA